MNPNPKKEAMKATLPDWEKEFDVPFAFHSIDCKKIDKEGLKRFIRNLLAQKEQEVRGEAIMRLVELHNKMSWEDADIQAGVGRAIQTIKALKSNNPATE